jgi:formate dehydrogenase major subunit
VRGWISLVAQRRQLGLSQAEAFTQAWTRLAERNPFPATLGRICPHPCEAGCSRGEKDGAVAINALERFLGDWALARRLQLPVLAPPRSRPESIGVIGAGPAGLSFAYQMSRRGYDVTIYERAEHPGGMLYYGIPEYRLPETILTREIDRLLAVGITLHLNTPVGAGIGVEALRQKHQTVFVGIGAGMGRTLSIPGERGPGVWTGTDYLAEVNRGTHLRLGQRVLVVGGGNTAIDAARTARRTGAEVTILYRRTRAEMPAIDAEIEDAIAEGVTLTLLSAPAAILRRAGQVRAVVLQRMQLGDPDGSGRRAPTPVPGEQREVPADAVIVAVSQQPDWDGLDEVAPATPWVVTGADGAWEKDLWAGGDALGVGLAAVAIGQGRRAAEAADAGFRGLPHPGVANNGPRLSTSAVKPDFYAPRARVSIPRMEPKNRLLHPTTEVEHTIGEQDFLEEVSRCFSCGLCFGCQQCFMYCSARGITPSLHGTTGGYFDYALELCQGCRSCIELCPCGFLSAATPDPEATA